MIYLSAGVQLVSLSEICHSAALSGDRTDHVGAIFNFLHTETTRGRIVYELILKMRKCVINSALT